MATKVIMPQGGQDITEGRVVSWLKSEGDPVQRGDVICEVETEKAVFEVESPADGVLSKILVPAGEIAQIFSTIAVIGEPGETIDLDKFLADEKKEGSDLDISKIRKRMDTRNKKDKGNIKVSGRAKKIATQKGVDLSAIEGTGPKGRIVEKDVLAYLEQQTAAPSRAFNVAASAPAIKGDRGKTVPMSKMRRVIARRMLHSKQTIPHFYVTVSVEMNAAIRLRQTLNQNAEPKISINNMIVKASALALEEFHQVNSIFQEDEIIFPEDINIGIAVGLDDGLVVPVLPKADKLSLKEIAQQSREITGLAQAGKQPNLEPGSFTVSNMAMMNVENFVAIINPPESAILAIGSTEKKVVVSNSNDFSIRDVMKMTLSVDHRLVDGVLASKFINKIKYHLQNPKTLLS
jgi:pyruvate dehydrogenase E2 component (dihydrolipoamide acetyltransferase)